MENIDLKRKSIRAMFREAFEDTAKFIVITSASKRPKSLSTPQVVIRTPESEEKQQGKSVYRCTTLVMVSLVVSGQDEPEDLVDELASEAHSLVKSRFNGSQEIEKISRVKSRTGSREGGSDLSGKIDLYYEVTYSVNEREAPTGLKKFKGVHAELGVSS